MELPSKGGVKVLPKFKMKQQKSLNVHNLFTISGYGKKKKKWEKMPSIHWKLDIKNEVINVK